MKNLLISLLVLGLSISVYLNLHLNSKLQVVKENRVSDETTGKTLSESSFIALEKARLELLMKTIPDKSKELNVSGRYMIYLPDIEYNKNNSQKLNFTHKIYEFKRDTFFEIPFKALD